ncbi:MAG: hypothetical protein ABJL99_04440 [Aliishimia sp.]
MIDPSIVTRIQRCALFQIMPARLGQNDVNRCAAFFAILTLLGAAANAQALCNTIDTLHPNSNDVQMSMPGSGEVVTCTRSLMLSGGAQIHCGWAFAYRSPAATQAFETLVSTVAECLGDGAAITADLDVNHPDFYDLQTFQLGDQEVGVSLKDKASLSETYVFLRVALPN